MTVSSSGREAMTCKEVKKHLTAILSGLVIRYFQLLEGGTLILYFGHDLSPKPKESKGTRLWIESAWRLRARNRIIAGSLDSPDVLMRQLQTLKGMTVRSVRLDGKPGDIIVTLQSGVIVETFTRSVGDEQWQLRRPDGFRLGLRENLELYQEMEDPD